VIRFLAPLVISDDELDEGLAVVTDCVAEAIANPPTPAA
jgi:4-aminobutyrate aminotransferase-like enzyme